MDGSYFDPAASLGGEDPLRAWASQNLDATTGSLLLTDPQRAIAEMIKKGIAPPIEEAMAYSAGEGVLPNPNNSNAMQPPNAMYNSLNPPDDPSKPSIFSPPGPQATDGIVSAKYETPTNPQTGAPIGAPGAPMVTSGPKKNIFGQEIPALPKFGDKPAATPAPVPAPIAAPAPPAPLPVAPVPPAPVVADAPLDPVPLPRSDPRKEGSTDVGAKKKEGDGDNFASLTKALQGLKPVQPPALNAVGTPGAPSHSNPGAPNVQALLQYLSQNPAAASSVGLGRLLAAGRV